MTTGRHTIPDELKEGLDPLRLKIIEQAELISNLTPEELKRYRGTQRDLEGARKLLREIESNLIRERARRCITNPPQPPN